MKNQHLLMKVMLLQAAVLCVSSSYASSVLKSGDFVGDARGGESNNISVSHVDQGWITKNFTWGVTNGGDTTFSSDQATVGSNYSRGLGQIVSLSSVSGTQLDLSFDWTASASAAADALNISYQVIAWKTPTAPGVSDGLFNAINFRSYGVRNTSGAGNSWANLVDGSIGTSTGTVDTGFGTFLGTAGTLETANITLDLAALSLGDISDYDLLGIKFNAGTGGSEQVSGGILDNVSLMASTIAVPTPSAAAMGGLMAVGLLVCRRRR